MLYQSRPDVYSELKVAFPDDYKKLLWKINQTALEVQIRNTAEFEYSLNGLTSDAADVEKRAIEAVRNGNWDEVKLLLGGDKTRMHEVELLFKAGYDYKIDSETNIIHWTKE